MGVRRVRVSTVGAQGSEVTCRDADIDCSSRALGRFEASQAGKYSKNINIQITETEDEQWIVPGFIFEVGSQDQAQILDRTASSITSHFWFPATRGTCGSADYTDVAWSRAILIPSAKRELED
ncbi:hypothetical protein Q7C36_017036 [Tachysurus vachellii]|uniref:Uncharacterized protein n=1 Tax=Tachysurus vachellii TaxID=175792 RepID=A0AA88SEF1_TACVA|nr:hypothetical protein Q7C36_017036 [Tachysurus vachellii]